MLSLRIPLTLSILLSVSPCLAGYMGHAPVGPLLPPAEFPQRLMHFDFSVERNGEFVQEAGFANRSAVTYQLKDDRLDVRQSAFTFTGLDTTRYDGVELWLETEGNGDHTGFQVIGSFLDHASGANVAQLRSVGFGVPLEWDEPATWESIERLADTGAETLLLTNVDGPWKNVGEVVFDGMVRGDHFRVTLDRLGYFQRGSVVLGVPEPSSLALLILGLSVSWAVISTSRAHRTTKAKEGSSAPVSQA